MNREAKEREKEIEALRDEAIERAAKAITGMIPVAFFDATMENTIRLAIRSWRPGPAVHKTVNETLERLVSERASEMLKSTFSKEVDELAVKVARDVLRR